MTAVFDSTPLRTLFKLTLLCVLLLPSCDRTANEQPEPLKVGLITNNPNGLRNIQGFKDEMTALGYVEDQHVSYLYSGQPTKQKDLDTAIESMLTAGVDLIFTAGTPTGVAAHRVTAGTDVPVVFGVIADPVSAGVIVDLARPGGNLTGVMLSQNQARRLDLFLRIAPGRRKILVPYNPGDAAPASAVRQIATVAQELGVELVARETRTDDEVTELLSDFPTDVEAIFLVPDSTVNRRFQDILEVANAYGIPISGPSTAQVEEGALMTYGFVHREAGAQAARIADHVIKGVRPRDLPVQTAEFFLVINLESAARIGLELSEDSLRQADVIIRRRDARHHARKLRWST